MVWYGKVKAEQNNFFSSQELWSEIRESLETPLGDLDKFSQLDVLTTDNSHLSISAIWRPLRTM